MRLGWLAGGGVQVRQAVAGWGGVRWGGGGVCSLASPWLRAADAWQDPGRILAESAALDLIQPDLIRSNLIRSDLTRRNRCAYL